MRWLLLKDLQILRRSPLIVALLVAYPVALGVLIGFALSGDNSKPRVAFLNEVPDEQQFQIGGGEERDRSRDRARRALLAGRVRRRLHRARRPSRRSRTGT